MAGLSLGVPIVTTSGRLTRSCWRQGDLVSLAPADSPEAIAIEIDGILRDSPKREALGQRGEKAIVGYFHLKERLKDFVAHQRIQCSPNL